jgi:hypothetical protein
MLPSADCIVPLPAPMLPLSVGVGLVAHPLASISAATASPKSVVCNSFMALGCHGSGWASISGGPGFGLAGCVLLWCWLGGCTLCTTTLAPWCMLVYGVRAQLLAVGLKRKKAAPPQYQAGDAANVATD